MSADIMARLKAAAPAILLQADINANAESCHLK